MSCGVGIDTSKVTNVVMADVDPRDYPDFCDAYVLSAEYEGREMTDEELIALNHQCGDFVNEQAHESLR